MPLRSSTGSCSATLRPATKMEPSDGSMRRLIIFIVVVFPQPEGPTSTTVSPRAMSIERPLTAASPDESKRFDTSTKEIISSAMESPGGAPGTAVILRRTAGNSTVAIWELGRAKKNDGGMRPRVWEALRLPVHERQLGTSHHVGCEVVENGEHDVHEGRHHGTNQPEDQRPALDEPQRDIDVLPQNEKSTQPLDAIE